MVRKVKAWVCGFCDEIYFTKKEAVECEELDIKSKKYLEAELKRLGG